MWHHALDAGCPPTTLHCPLALWLSTPAFISRVRQRRACLLLSITTNEPAFSPSKQTYTVCEFLQTEVTNQNILPGLKNLDMDSLEARSPRPRTGQDDTPWEGLKLPCLQLLMALGFSTSGNGTQVSATAFAWIPQCV